MGCRGSGMNSKLALPRLFFFLGIEQFKLRSQKNASYKFFQEHDNAGNIDANDGAEGGQRRRICSVIVNCAAKVGWMN